MDRVSIERMCVGREFQVEGADRGRDVIGAGANVPLRIA